jgi:hypothetical protein
VIGDLTEEVAAALRRGLVEAFAIEMAKAEAIQYVVSAALAPIMDRIEREVTAKGPVGGPDAVRRIIAQLDEVRAQGAKAD